jgi:hypothetical protein
MADGGKSNKSSTELKRLQQAEDGKKAMLDYEREAAALRAKTERLRVLRLARDGAASQPSVIANAGKKPAKTSKAKPTPLSEWLDDQKRDGRRD